MADNLDKKRPQDSSRISLSEKWEIAYWTKELGVNEDELRAAVNAAGNSAKAVREQLSRK
jgi:hypothetical protein